MQRHSPHSELTEGSVTVNGIRMHYQKAGNGPPLVLVHGLVGSWRNWDQNIEFLARTATVYAIDLVNMGDSQRVLGLDSSLEATADSLAGFLHALDLERADVAGHSHGGAIAMMLAARHPSLVRRLVLFAPANPFCDMGSKLIGFYQTPLGAWFARRIPGLPRGLHKIALSRMYGDPRRVAENALEGYTTGLDLLRVQHVLSILRGWAEDMRVLSEALVNVRQRPTLLIWGDRDRAVGLSSGERLAETLGASLLVLEGVGHVSFAERPEDCNRIITDWLHSGTTAH